jgi:single-strand DNA-binding protein
MATYNRVILLGNLTRDPELSYTPSSTPVCKFGLATNRRWRDQSGEMRDETCFVDCTVFGRQAETFNQYMRKGRPVLVEGRLSFSQWTGQDGQKRSKHEVIIERYQFVGGRQEGSGGRPAAVPPSAEAGYDGGPTPDAGGAPPPDIDGDIPF